MVHLNHPMQYMLCQNSGKVLQTLIDNQELVQKLLARGRIGELNERHLR